MSAVYTDQEESALARVWHTPLHDLFIEELAKTDKIGRRLEGAMLIQNQGKALFLEQLLADIEAAQKSRRAKTMTNTPVGASF